MRVPDEVKDSVFYICAKVSTGLVENYQLMGTGFFIALPVQEFDIHFVHLVTAKHVIEDTQKLSIDNRIHLRLNTHEGGFAYAEADAHFWKTHPNDKTVDVAVMLVAPDRNKYDYKAIPLTMAAIESHQDYETIGAGDEVFITGLFVNHFGQNRNIPIIRTGNIAMMNEEPVQTQYGASEAILIEARSIGGLSGSPVFVHKYAIEIKDKSLVYREGGNPLYWLGLIHGHWDVTTTPDNLMVDATQNRINMGIAVVVPAGKVIEVMNHPELEEKRKKELNQHRNKNLPAIDTVENKDIKNENFTRDNFMSALENVIDEDEN